MASVNESSGRTGLDLKLVEEHLTAQKAVQDGRLLDITGRREHDRSRLAGIGPEEVNHEPIEQGAGRSSG